MENKSDLLKALEIAQAAVDRGAWTNDTAIKFMKAVRDGELDVNEWVGSDG